MKRKNLYIQIYQRFCREHNLNIEQRACEDILNANRLLFGIVPAYHRPYAAKWIKCIFPFFVEDMEYTFNKMGVSTNAQWDLGEFIKYWLKSQVSEYLHRMASKSFDTGKLFHLYGEAMDREYIVNN